MDYEIYRQNYFVDPPPKPRLNFAGIYGFSLFFEAYEEALDYYSRVFGPPAYKEGDFTRGWKLGET